MHNPSNMTKILTLGIALWVTVRWVTYTAQCLILPTSSDLSIQKHVYYASNRGLLKCCRLIRNLDIGFR